MYEIFVYAMRYVPMATVVAATVTPLATVRGQTQWEDVPWEEEEEAGLAVPQESFVTDD